MKRESLLPDGETWKSIVPKAFGDGILWLTDILGGSFVCKQVKNIYIYINGLLFFPFYRFCKKMS